MSDPVQEVNNKVISYLLNTPNSNVVKSVLVHQHVMYIFWNILLHFVWEKGWKNVPFKIYISSITHTTLFNLFRFVLSCLSHSFTTSVCDRNTYLWYWWWLRIWQGRVQSTDGCQAKTPYMRKRPSRKRPTFQVLPWAVSGGLLWSEVLSPSVAHQGTI